VTIKGRPESARASPRASIASLSVSPDDDLGDLPDRYALVGDPMIPG
jgi:hypothetical protein